MQKNAKTVNLSLQLLPLNHTGGYPIVTEAIRAIQESGVKHRVQPLSTVMEGELEELLQIVQKAKTAAEEAGAEELMLTLQIHIKKNEDVHFEDKTGKFE